MWLRIQPDSPPLKTRYNVKAPLKTRALRRLSFENNQDQSFTLNLRKDLKGWLKVLPTTGFHKAFQQDEASEIYTTNN